jgi:hypothetical protein
VIVTGAGPQENVMMPPAATAATNAADVQLAGVPSPTTCVGCDVSTGRPAEGTEACPFGLPALGRLTGGGGLRAVVVVIGGGAVAGRPMDEVWVVGGGGCATGRPGTPHAASTSAEPTAAKPAAVRRTIADRSTPGQHTVKSRAADVKAVTTRSSAGAAWRVLDR